MTAHERHVCRGIHPAAQINADRDVAHHSFLDRGLEQVAELGGQLPFVDLAHRLARRQVPPAPGSEAILGAPAAAVRGRELGDSGEQRAGRRRRQERQVVAQRLEIYRATKFRVLQKCLDLRREDPALPGLRVVQRLLARAIASEEQAPPARVPDREGEHAVEPREAILAVFLVRGEHHFGVAAGLETAPGAFKLCPEGSMVIDLAVVGEHDRSVGVGHGLLPGDQVNDFQPSRAETNASVR